MPRNQTGLAYQDVLSVVETEFNKASPVVARDIKRIDACYAPLKFDCFRHLIKKVEGTCVMIRGR